MIAIISKLNIGCAKCYKGLSIQVFFAIPMQVMAMLQYLPKQLQKFYNKKKAFSIFFDDWPAAFHEANEAWIIGGDGTLNYFINRYPGVDIPLSIFKGGTGNDFANFLYLNKNVEEQVELILNGKPHLIDGAICNNKLFINGVGIGFDGAIVKDLAAKNKSKSKSSYLYSILKNIFFYKEKECNVQCNEQVYKAEYFMINILNGQSFGGGFKVAPKAVLNDGRLDLNMVEKISPLKRLYYVPVIKKGNHIGLSFIKYHQEQKVEIQSACMLPAHLDGEYFSSDHFIIECLSGKFSFIC